MEKMSGGTGQPLDLNRVRYDLALLYAREKFKQALKNKAIPNAAPGTEHPQYMDETDYLLEEFLTAFTEYSTKDNLELLKQMDVTFNTDHS